MGFFSKIGTALQKGVGVMGGVLQTMAPAAALIPGLGTVISGAAGATGSLLSSLSGSQQSAIVGAVQEQGVVKLDKIEQTIVNNGVTDPAVVQQQTALMTQVALQANPTAKVDDSKSLTSVDTLTKITQWIKSNFIIVGLLGVGAFFFLGKKGRRSSRW